ncbi:hypothetical protein TIFTF001_009537 [Ficus carica]|uniref:Uncharacterized protein n=1 Tax=Ficus carica TaxID=3494 RepID=A0AA87ZTY7_FICCA|nr:hypothetical protein TIFTF001_009537 [Ficus carica]
MPPCSKPAQARATPFQPRSHPVEPSTVHPANALDHNEPALIPSTSHRLKQPTTTHPILRPPSASTHDDQLISPISSQ